MSLAPPSAPGGSTTSADNPSRWTAVPLRTQLVALVTALLFIALTVTGFGLQSLLQGFLLNQTDDGLQQARNIVERDPRILADLMEDPNRSQFPSTYLFQFTTDNGSRSWTVNSQGHRGATKDRHGGWDDDSVEMNQGTSQPLLPAITYAQAQAMKSEPYTIEDAEGDEWRAVVLPARQGREPGSVVIAQSMGAVHEPVERLRRVSVVMGLLVLVACALIGWIAIRRAFTPLSQVEATAAKIADGDLSQRIPAAPEGTEVGSLTTSLNAMLTQIEGAFRQREASEARTRRFAADASHELRTPLASVRGYAELYRQGAVPDDEVARVMQRIEDEAKRMGLLVEDLLLLARLDEQRPIQSEPVDLAVLAGDAADDVRALAPDRTVRLVGLGDGSGPEPAPVLGDENRLRQVVANLTGNAVRHTPAGTPIEIAVGVDRATSRSVLEVRDHGPGLSAEHAERIFERFYRVDASRHRGSGGSGLGLSIVSAVIAAHAGTVEVRTTDGGGATFVINLPMSGGAAEQNTTTFS